VSEQDTGDAFLSLEEVQRVILAALGGSNRPLTDAELERVYDWAHGVRVENAMLAVVLRGDVLIEVPTAPEAGLIFHAPQAVVASSPRRERTSHGSSQ
jgi:hypothetical protein